MSQNIKCAYQGCRNKPYPGLSKCGVHMNYTPPMDTRPKARGVR